MAYRFINYMRNNNLIEFPVNRNLYLKYGIMSIQASAYHYCTPRVNNLNIKDYKSFEIGVICEDKKIDEMLKPYRFSKIKNDEMKMKLYENVPIELVEQVYQLLK